MESPDQSLSRGKRRSVAFVALWSPSRSLQEGVDLSELLNGEALPYRQEIVAVGAACAGGWNEMGS